MSGKTILVWFRNDLRIHDNEILIEAVRKADNILPVYCFDPYYFTKNFDGTVKTGNIRAKFIIESVANLRNNLRKLGGDLLIRVGNPAEVLPALAAEYQVNEVYHHREVASEETSISEAVETALWKMKLNLKHFIGHTLYHKEDLPFPIKDIPDSFAIFRKKIERESTVRVTAVEPIKINVPDIADAGELPTLADLGLTEPLEDERATIKFKGGETVALEKLNALFPANKPLAAFKSPRGIFPSAAISSKLSAWISVGCLSLRQVYWAVISYQQLNETQEGDTLLLDLLWRDFFRFMFKKHGQKFIATGAGVIDDATVTDKEILDSWKNGQTGIPVIDAIMHELNATGYINNYSRQVAADFLVNILKLDWKKGAAYFEEKLIDYSPASNWGNWAFIAGVNDARESKYNLAIKKTFTSDISNDYTNLWLPLSKFADYQA